jgi:hypothetical protein
MVSYSASDRQAGFSHSTHAPAAKQAAICSACA